MWDYGIVGRELLLYPAKPGLADSELPWLFFFFILLKVVVFDTIVVKWVKNPPKKKKSKKGVLFIS